MRMIAGAIVLMLLGACATPYQSVGMGGGFTDAKLRDDIWRVRFDGNGHTTAETVQTYWLYRAAELTLEQGYAGFELLSDIRFVSAADGESSEGNLVLTRSAPVFVPLFMPSAPVTMPQLQADIRLLKKPFEALPPRVFDAAEIKAALGDLVTGKKCARENVCPHVHEYVVPKGRLAPRST